MNALKKTAFSIFNALFSKESWKTLAGYMGLGRSLNKSLIIDTESLQVFLNTRASHVSQSALYGYLKTRAGTRFPEMFENPGLLLSINMAKWQIWLSCLSDLSIYMGGLIYHRTNLDSEKISNILLLGVSHILESIGTPEEAAEAFPDAVEAIKIRIMNCDFKTITDGECAFSLSPEALYNWAPIDDELKKRDKEIVKNSVRFRWKEVRSNARELLQADSLIISAG